MELNIKCLNDNATNFYTNNDEQLARGDAGYDLYYCGESVVIQPYNTLWESSDMVVKPTMLGLGIACQPKQDNGYYLYPRSSISKTPLQLANNVGIIDFGYRGEIMAAVKNYSPYPYTVNTGDRLFQLCMHDLKPFKVYFVDNINNTIRGDGGFGSTNQDNVFESTN